MKRFDLLLLLASLAFAAPVFAQTAPKKGAPAPAVAAASAAPQGMLRIACSGENLGAEVSIDGASKGECPVDLALPEGNWTVRAVKRTGEDRQRAFESSFRLVGGTARKVEIELGQPGYMPAAEARKVEEIVAPFRAARGTVREDCPDCPRVVPLSVVPSSLKTPSLDDPQMQAWLKEAAAGIERFYASNQAGPEFTPPARSAPFPCKGAEAQMRAAAALPSLRVAAEGGPSSKVWNVRSSCDAKGELDGPADFWAFEYRNTDADSMFIVRSRLTHFQGSFAAGKPRGEHRVVRIQGNALLKATEVGRKIGLRDSGAAKALHADIYWFIRDGYPVRREMQVSSQLDEGKPTGEWVAVSSTTWDDSDRGESRNFYGGKLRSVMSMKGDRVDGFAKFYEDDGEVTTTCFRDSQVAKDPDYCRAR